MFLTIPFNPFMMLAFMVFCLAVILFGYRAFKWFRDGMAKANAELKKEKKGH